MVTKITCLLIIITHRIHSMRAGNVFIGVCHSGNQVHGLVGVRLMAEGEVKGGPPTPFQLAERIGTEDRGRIVS